MTANIVHVSHCISVKNLIKAEILKQSGPALTAEATPSMGFSNKLLFQHCLCELHELQKLQQQALNLAFAAFLQHFSPACDNRVTNQPKTLMYKS